jgi:hypothetical protein
MILNSKQIKVTVIGAGSVATHPNHAKGRVLRVCPWVSTSPSWLDCCMDSRHIRSHSSALPRSPKVGALQELRSDVMDLTETSIGKELVDSILRYASHVSWNGRHPVH